MSDFQPSALGTQTYWDQYYINELTNFDEIGEEGEIWFGKSSEKRIINYLKQIQTSFSSRILDAGSGNGHFCIELAKAGFSDITGVDYSPQAVQLANNLLKAEYLPKAVSFKCVDLLSTESIKGNLPLDRLFDIIIDKGTFDAISLSRSETGDNCNSTSISSENRKLYLRHILNLLKLDGFFLITSCNWTANELVDELENIFSKESFSDSKAAGVVSRNSFKFVFEVQSLRKFTFGGVTGSDTPELNLRPSANREDAQTPKLLRQVRFLPAVKKYLKEFSDTHKFATRTTWGERFIPQNY